MSKEDLIKIMNDIIKEETIERPPYPDKNDYMAVSNWKDMHKTFTAFENGMKTLRDCIIQKLEIKEADSE